MTDIKDGGPAFPRTYNGDGHNGMTMRDYFAAKAMQGILACESDTNVPAYDVTLFAYAQADAMIKAREF